MLGIKVEVNGAIKIRIMEEAVMTTVYTPRGFVPR